MIFCMAHEKGGIERGREGFYLSCCEVPENGILSVMGAFPFHTTFQVILLL